MKLPVDFSDDNQLLRAFIYFTRIGLAPKYGKCNISYYQGTQCRIIEYLEGMLKPHLNLDAKKNIKVNHGYLYYLNKQHKWTMYESISYLRSRIA